MATFYLLPTRLQVGRQFSQFLDKVCPGPEWEDENELCDLAEQLAETLQSHPGVYVIFREDLPDDEPALDILERDFGVESTDQVIDTQWCRALAAAA